MQRLNINSIESMVYDVGNDPAALGRANLRPKAKWNLQIAPYTKHTRILKGLKFKVSW